MPIVILESETLIEFVAPRIEVISFQMHSLDADCTASLDGKIHGRLSDALPASLGSHVKLVNETVSSMKLKREPEAENHVADQLLRFFEKNKPSEIPVFA